MLLPINLNKDKDIHKILTCILTHHNSDYNSYLSDLTSNENKWFKEIMKDIKINETIFPINNITKNPDHVKQIQKDFNLSKPFEVNNPLLLKIMLNIKDKTFDDLEKIY